MSFQKLDPIFPLKNKEINRDDLVNLVQHSLYHDFGNSSQASDIRDFGRLIRKNSENF